MTVFKSHLETKDKSKKASVYRGVYKCGRKWKSQIQIKGVQIYLGVFDTEIEAAEKYDEAAQEHGKFSTLNFEQPNDTGSSEFSGATNHDACSMATLKVQGLSQHVLNQQISYSREKKIELGKVIKTSIDLRKELALMTDPVLVLSLLNKLDALKEQQLTLARAFTTAPQQSWCGSEISDGSDTTESANSSYLDLSFALDLASIGSSSRWNCQPLNDSSLKFFEV